MDNIFAQIKIKEVTEDKKVTKYLENGIHGDLNVELSYLEEDEKTKVQMKFSKTSNGVESIHQETHFLTEKNMQMFIDNKLAPLFYLGVPTIEKCAKFKALFNESLSMEEFVNKINEEFANVKVAIKIASWNNKPYEKKDGSGWTSNYFNKNKIKFDAFGTYPAVVNQSNISILTWNEQYDNQQDAGATTNSFVTSTLTASSVGAPLTFA